MDGYVCNISAFLRLNISETERDSKVLGLIIFGDSGFIPVGSYRTSRTCPQ